MKKVESQEPWKSMNGLWLHYQKYYLEWANSFIFHTLKNKLSKKKKKNFNSQDKSNAIINKVIDYKEATFIHTQQYKSKCMKQLELSEGFNSKQTRLGKTVEQDPWSAIYSALIILLDHAIYPLNYIIRSYPYNLSSKREKCYNHVESVTQLTQMSLLFIIRYIKLKKQGSFSCFRKINK